MRRLLVAVAIFAGSFAYFALLAAPAMSWANGSSDVGDYIMSARFLTLSHGISPTYNVIAHAWLQAVSLGNDAYSLSLLSALFSAVAVSLLFLISRSLLPPLIFVGSLVVVGQATVVDLNAMVILSGLVAYALHAGKHHTLKYLPLAGTHPFGVFYGLVFMVWDTLREKRPLWKAALPFALGLTPYLYLFLANTPNPWLADKSLSGLRAFLGYSSGLANGLTIWPPGEIILRESSLGLLLLASMGAALVPMAYGLREHIRRRDWLLPVLALLPVAYFATSFTQDTFPYLAYATPFFALLAWEGARVIPWRRAAMAVTVAGAVLLILVNGATMGIGRTLDRGLTAQAFYDALDALPDGAALDTQARGWEFQAVNLYIMRNPGRIDLLHEPARRATRTQREERALQEGRLYRTRVLDRVTLATAIEKVGP